MTLGARCLVMLALVPVGAHATAQSGADAKAETKQDAPPVDESAAGGLAALGFKEGPFAGKLGSFAEIQIPSGFLFAERRGAQGLLELTQNPPSGGEVGALLPAEMTETNPWFVIFTYEDSGHVKDDDRDDLDADELLDSMKEGNDAGNEERARRGWSRIELVGWQKPPFYDPKTNNLTWATIARSEQSESVNWSTKLLGRRGTMHVDLVLGKDQLDAALPAFEKLLEGFTYVDGERYAEFKAGDKVAEYGLAALVAGGAGVIAAKTGILAKFWKYILVGVLALGAGIKKLFGFGKKDAPGEGPAA